MDNYITLTTWLFLLLILFAAVMVLDRLLMPGLRWYLHCRVNKVITEVSTRLDIEIHPFQLTRQQSLIDQLVFDDWDLETLSLSQCNDLLKIMEDRHGNKSTLITSQLSLNKWHHAIEESMDVAQDLK